MQRKVKARQQKKTTSSRPKLLRTSQPVVEQGVAALLSVDSIDFSPFNYRKYIRKDELEAFAEEIRHHGIISPLTVRKMSSGRYELVAGERRLRAARIAKLKEVPGMIKALTDA